MKVMSWIIGILFAMWSVCVLIWGLWPETFMSLCVQFGIESRYAWEEFIWYMIPSGMIISTFVYAMLSGLEEEEEEEY